MPQVQLSPGYEHYSDASEGPLQPGVVGTLVEEDGSGKPYLVEAPNGKKWWYEKGALQAAQVRACFGGALSLELRAQRGRAEPGPDSTVSISMAADCRSSCFVHNSIESSCTILCNAEFSIRWETPHCRS